MRYLIVGGVAGGASVATRIRRLDERAEIVIYERTGYVSYANCGLPYYISGVISDPGSLTVQTPEGLKSRYNIDARVHCNVVSIDRSNKKIEIEDLETGKRFEDLYDRLILATGAHPRMLAPIGNRVFTLKNVEDALRLKETISKLEVKTATVIGGGAIGLEIAENLRVLGIDVTLIEGSSHVLPNFDRDMASYAHQVLENNWVHLRLSSLVKGVKELDDRVVATLDSGKLTSDILIQAVGNIPNSELAKDCGLDLDSKGFIVVDSNFQTSDPDIYAVGDVISIRSDIDGSISSVALAGPANREARELGTYLTKGSSNQVTGLGTSIVKVFDTAFASSGFTEERLKRANITYDKIYLSPTDHASYYPGSSALFMKVMFDPESGRILGAQIAGKNGVDKRIDLLAMAMKYGILAQDLSRAELSYAPPFGSAKDPINVVGFMVENLRSNLVSQFFPEDVEKIRNDSSIQLVDVRTEFEYQSGHIEGASNIPLDELRSRLNELDRSREVCIYCQGGVRSYTAYRILAQNGFRCRHLSGGYGMYSVFRTDLEKYR